MPDSQPASRSSRRGIGRGLSAILPEAGASRQDGYRELALELIRPNEDQPRGEFDAEGIAHLAQSIRARGLLQPVVVRPLPGGQFELIAGERRLRAAKEAGLDRVPALVRATQDSERLELALIENMAREDLNPVEEARACATLVEDLGITKEELARRLGRSRVAISNLVRLLQLPDEALAFVERGELSEGHGRALLLCKDQDARRKLAKAARSRRWSVRETEEHAKAAAQKLAGTSKRGPVVIHPDLQEALGVAEDALSAALGRDVRVRPVRGSYRVEFEVEDPGEGVELAERILGEAAGERARRAA